MTVEDLDKILQELIAKGKGDYDLLVNGCPKYNIETFDDYQEVVVWDIVK